MKNELYHHGVKGQQWGVRNGPPYPIENKVLAKGTRLNSVSQYGKSKPYRKSGRWMYTYNPDDEWDSKVYKGAFSKYLRLYRGNMFVYEHKYQTTKDLMMPTKKERMDEFKKVIDDTKYQKLYKNELKSVQKRLIDNNVGGAAMIEKYKKLDIDNLKTEEDYKTAYNVFSHAMEARYAYFVTRDYSKNMTKKYDAMVDDNNQGIYNEAHDPIIIFRADKFLTEVKDMPASRLTDDDIIENYDAVKKELEKKGKRVLL